VRGAGQPGPGPWWPSLGFALGSLGMLVSERILAGGPGSASLRVLSLGCLLAGLGLRGLRLRARAGGPRRAERWLLWATVPGVVALTLGLVTQTAALERWAPPALHASLSSAATVLVPLGWLGSALALLFGERTWAPMRQAGALEAGRLQQALGRGLELALALCLLFVLNVLAQRHDWSVDLSYFRTTPSSEATRRLAAASREPLEVLLFYPRASEVAEELEGYFAQLGSSAPLRVRRVDRMLEPSLARRYEVRADGQVVFLRGERRESLFVGTDPRAARTRLLRLDSDVHRTLRRLAGAGRRAYRTLGHGEWARAGADPPDAEPYPALETLLRQEGYALHDLGLAGGLASGVPPDAALLLVLAPRTPFLPEELATLRRYWESGGRVLLALDPEGGSDQAALAALLGLGYAGVPLAHEQQYLRQRGERSDRRNLVTDGLLPHPMSEGLRAKGRPVGFAFFGAGALRSQSPREELQIDFVLQSLPETWEDGDGDLEPGAAEPRGTFPLVAAVRLSRPAGGSAAPEARAVVLGDADFVSDAALRNRANATLLADGLRWLQGEPPGDGPPLTEQDRVVQHGGRDERLWFYATVFAVPLLLLGVAWLQWRRRRRP